jgi:SPW repeat
MARVVKEIAFGLSTWRRVSVLDVYKLAFGLLLMLSPWLFAFRHQPARFDSFIAGLLLVAAALASLVVYDDRKQLLMILVGLWVVVSPWILRDPRAAAMKIHIGFGLVVAYLAFLALFLIHYVGDERANRAAGQGANRTMS